MEPEKQPSAPPIDAVERRKRRRAKWAFIVLMTLLLSNVPVISFLIGIATVTHEAFVGPPLYLISGQQKFITYATEAEWEAIFKAYKKKNPEDTLLYRTYPKHLWQFWRWAEYYWVEHWHIPYVYVPPATLDSIFLARYYVSKEAFYGLEAKPQ